MHAAVASSLAAPAAATRSSRSSRSTASNAHHSLRTTRTTCTTPINRTSAPDHHFAFNEGMDQGASRLICDMDNPDNSQFVPPEIHKNLPGAIPEVHVPVDADAEPPLSAAATPAAAAADTAIPKLHVPVDAPVIVSAYSPRVNFVSPSVEAAKLYAKENRPMMRDAAGQLISYPISTPVAVLSDLGKGTQIYLEMLKRFIFYFFLASLFCVPSLAIILLSASKQIGSTQNSLLEPLKVFSIASLFNGNFNATDELSSASVDSQAVAISIANIDLVYCILFFMFSVYLSRWIDRRDKEVSEASLTPSDFTLQVFNLPNDVTVDELKELFSNNYRMPDATPSCALVRIAYNESKYLSAFMKQAQLIEAFENAEAACCRHDSAKNRSVLDKCKSAMSSNSDLINLEASKRGSETGASIVCAFVTLQLQSHVKQALVDYRDRWFYWCRLDSKFKIRGFAPRLANAPEPDDIIWENLGLSARSLFFRRSISSFFALLLIIVCFVVMVAAKLYSDAQTSDQMRCQSMSCGLPLVAYDLPTVTVAFKNITANNMSSSCDSCICADLQLKNPEVWIKTINFPAFNIKAADGSPAGLCTESASKSIIFYALSIATVVVSAVANVGGSWLLVILAKHLERHASRSQYLASVVSKTAIFLTLNVAIIPLIVYARIDDIRRPLERSLPFQFPIFSGPFPDFNEKWYSVVGVSFLVTLSTNALSKFSEFILLSIVSCKRSCCAKRQDTQRQLNRLFEGPTFLIESSVGYLVSLFFMTFVFSAGMPILMPMAFLFVTSLFWTDKIMLLRLYKKPLTTASNLLKPVVSFIPVACLMHSAFAVWCYSAKSAANVPLLPLPTLGPAIDTYVQAFNNITSTNPDAAGVIIRYNVVERVLNWVTFPSFIFCIILILYVVVFPWMWMMLRYQPAFIIVFGILKGFFQSIFAVVKFCCCCSRNKVVPLGVQVSPPDQVTYDVALKTGMIRGVKDYELGSNPLYSSAA